MPEVRSSPHLRILPDDPAYQSQREKGPEQDKRAQKPPAGSDKNAVPLHYLTASHWGQYLWPLQLNEWKKVPATVSLCPHYLPLRRSHSSLQKLHDARQVCPLIVLKNSRPPGGAGCG